MNGLERGGTRRIREGLRSCLGGIALFGSRDSARGMSAVVHAIFRKRGFCEVAVAASAGRLVAGL